MKETPARVRAGADIARLYAVFRVGSSDFVIKLVSGRHVGSVLRSGAHNRVDFLARPRQMDDLLIVEMSNRGFLPGPTTTQCKLRRRN